ncbi:outer membrane protein assembly factor BamD [Amphritea sp. 1_MG-2023]|uniref:outer membrane protein assembly factor BamD n=1 Tax=Amphritea sp. 1_MG-2023 TaxID=3062670 RepID=UPI0026E40773|nr:outer membrane protein assembly factor BamD [Amphritea sp. 1_MG-2023]MDO6563624.1 outer membrane protein assembly factor BamD [Amphritea sp. 1_MG-2023]
MRLAKLLAIISITLMASGCSWFGGDEKEAPDVPEQQLYEEALDMLEGENYVAAVEKLQLLESRYPFGRFSDQAQLELIYAYHKNYESDAARATADRFIRLNPNHENIDYALYLKGLTAFEKDRTFFEKYLPIDETQRDPGSALDSFQSFQQLVSRFPNSQYAPDAQKRMTYLKNRLATHEMHVARYYVKREAWVAAANRGRYVLENYQQTPALPDALSVMVLAYNELGMTDLAADAQAVLDTNFPGYQSNIQLARKESLLSSATFGLFGSATISRPVEQPQSQPAEPQQRSWFSRLTFGLFDSEAQATE